MMEKKGILGDSDKPGRRPGDVTVPLWRRGLGLAIDVAVTCPFAVSNLSRSDPCEHYAEAKKHSYYDAGFKGTQFEFAAMVFRVHWRSKRGGPRCSSSTVSLCC